MNKILITGGNGYIGIPLIKFFKKLKIETISFDLDNSNNSNTLYFTGDLGQKEDIRKCFNLYKIDKVIHLAASAGVETNEWEYNSYFHNNVIGTYNLLEVMREFEVKNIIFASSCSVYGNNFCAKETDICRPISFYGLSKVISEQMLLFYNKIYGINYDILRIFNVIGTGGQSEFQLKRLIPTIIYKIKNNKPINIHSKKYKKEPQIRDFVDLDIVIGIIYKLSQNNRTNDIYNIGSGNKTSIKEICEICAEKLDKNLTFKLVNGRRGDPDIIVANIDKLVNKLDLKQTKLITILNKILKEI